MKLFFSFLRSKWPVFLTFFLFGVVFAVTFFLYNLPLSAVIYPFFLCALLGTGGVLYHYNRTKKRHELLRQIASLSADLMNKLPSSESIEESDYQIILSLLKEQITQTQEKAATRYSDTVEYFTLWAHQIKTPIAAMRLKLQNEDSPLSRQLRNDLNRIELYVEMVLTFLRLESDSTDYVFRECDLDELIRSCAKKFAGEFIDRKLKFDFQPTSLKILTDEKWLSFVLEQLFSNALKYTPQGTISVYAEAPAVLCIQDTGIGIAAEDLPRIFENGFTGFNGRSDRKASGIGLYLCKTVCSNLGHGIEAQSVLNQGTVIKLHLSTKKIEIE
ncbi:MAG TPA: hypothetical protein DDY98_04395 [Ruminococcaceae bacterium]|nr:hypothetical protein [Oscillospiraceae bacterium]